MPPRETVLDWGIWVYLEMFVVGVAAGAYFVAMLLELTGRGRSSVARYAHFIAFPLTILAAAALTIDLNRPERALNMFILSKTLVPGIKTWSPISYGSWLLFVFGALSFVSFADALFDRTRFRLGRWRPTRTVHGTKLGSVWSVVTGVIAFPLGMYSGLLLGTTNIPGWSDSVLLGAMFVVTAGLTGAATLVLIGLLWPARRMEQDRGAFAQLQEFMALLAIAWLVIVVVAFIAMGDARSAIVHGPYAVALLVAIVFAGVAPLVARFVWLPKWRSAPMLLALLVVVGGFLLRFAIVMGPQEI